MSEPAPPAGLWDRLPAAFSRRRRRLQLFYVLAALGYAALLLYWGRHDLERVNREYRQARTRVASGYALERARIEVEAGCRDSAGGRDLPGFAECLRASEPLVAKRATVLAGELERDKRQALRKLLIFYGMLGGVLFFLPVAAVYAFLAIFLYLLGILRFDDN